MLTQINLPDELHKALKVYLAQNEITNMPSGIIKILGEKLLPQIDNIDIEVEMQDAEIIKKEFENDK